MVFFYVVTVIGLVMFILSMVWYFSSPGQDAGDLLRQGVIIGPYLQIISSALVLAFGITAGTVGVVRFARSNKQRRYRRRERADAW